ncbi:hypothetical protein BDK63_002119 [Halomonas campaniensis]|uniref:Uncharacterized protein n=1 Tax=Halomonas campaniensis TaxID=213554 RepID=A0A7W5PB51_9GAMM|nr:hypothetical protein [Halomonas campaniensis]
MTGDIDAKRLALRSEQQRSRLFRRQAPERRTVEGAL